MARCKYTLTEEEQAFAEGALSLLAEREAAESSLASSTQQHRMQAPGAADLSQEEQAAHSEVSHILSPPMSPSLSLQTLALDSELDAPHPHSAPVLDAFRLELVERGRMRPRKLYSNPWQLHEGRRAVRSGSSSPTSIGDHSIQGVEIRRWGDLDDRVSCVKGNGRHSRHLRNNRAPSGTGGSLVAAGPPVSLHRAHKGCHGQLHDEPHMVSQHYEKEDEAFSQFQPRLRKGARPRPRERSPPTPVLGILGAREQHAESMSTWLRHHTPNSDHVQQPCTHTHVDLPTGVRSPPRKHCKAACLQSLRPMSAIFCPKSSSDCTSPSRLPQRPTTAMAASVATSCPRLFSAASDSSAIQITCARDRSCGTFSPMRGATGATVRGRSTGGWNAPSLASLALEQRSIQRSASTPPSLALDQSLSTRKLKVSEKNVWF
jgi:hypothetical protein